MTKRNAVTTQAISWALPLLLIACTESTPESDAPSVEPVVARSVAPASSPVIAPPQPKPTAPPPSEPAAPPPRKPTPTYAGAMKQAAALRERGDSAGAIELYLEAAEIQPQQWRPLVAAARLLIEGKVLPRARELAERAVKVASGSSSAWNTLGRVELLTGKLAAAERAFEKAAEHNESNIWAWNNLGLTRIKRQRYDEAVEALERATESDNATAYMFNNLGIAYERATRVQEALTAYKTGLEKGSGIAGQNFVRLEREAGPFGAGPAKVNSEHGSAREDGERGAASAGRQGPFGG